MAESAKINDWNKAVIFEGQLGSALNISLHVAVLPLSKQGKWRVCPIFPQLIAVPVIYDGEVTPASHSTRRV